MKQEVLDLISRIGGKETLVRSKEFISPVFTNTLVATQVEGIIYSFSIPKVKEGWYRIKPQDVKSAKIIGPADLGEIEGYLKHLDRIRLTLLMKKNGVYLGLPDKSNKYGFFIEEPLSVYLCDDSPLDFDRIFGRYDGANIWYEGIDQSNDPAKAEYLRQAMLRLEHPEKIKFSGLNIEEKLAYTLRMTFDKRFVEDRKKIDLREDVEFAGGKFIDFVEKQDHFSVTYVVDGQQFTSHISKEPRRMVISAGLCLAGGDKKFDLKSLISVIREGQDKDLIHEYHLE